ncbi:hypothetical protein AYK25_05460 [Thermoplasmatales archaeon SM1-50]|nr:MAG: hypothetical protein AYK25_05460 [Thermoplasmatales archaeon SM1-50]
MDGCAMIVGKNIIIPSITVIRASSFNFIINLLVWYVDFGIGNTHLGNKFCYCINQIIPAMIQSEENKKN